MHALNPRLVMVRMPAFGLDGPWRDHVGFAQTMEQITGLAWLTGHPDDQPRIQRGPCDPLAGMHAAFATLVGARRARRARAAAISLECAMVEGALNAAAEQVDRVHRARVTCMQREGNRAPARRAAGPLRLPRRASSGSRSRSRPTRSGGRCVGALGDPAWARDPRSTRHAGRRAAHDRLDAELARWAAAARASSPPSRGCSRQGVPAAPRGRSAHDAHAPAARRARLLRDARASRRRHAPGVPRCPSATRRVDALAAQLRRRRSASTTARSSAGCSGLADAEIDALEAAGVIGTRPKGL